ncbi:MAG: type III-B CRISPR module RAMP protein Cmr6 [Gammaproteobacteria bacterium]|nr:type III-B CRISPR module RAMP protein Cmr6 [Gammaproteobacteria bacterium]
MASGSLIGHRRETVQRVLSDNLAQAHSGLIFDHFLAMWAHGRGLPTPQKPLREPLQMFVEDFHRGGRSEYKKSLLREHHERLANTAPRYATRQWDLQVQWRLTTGLGSTHPTENGFLFHELLGVPYLSGAAVKGLCRTAAKVLDAAPARIKTLLGSETTAQPLAGGDLVFYDALPSVWPRLVVDIVNCHHPDYYSQQRTDKKDPPAEAVETESPVPVFFLAVDAGACFRFRLGSRAKSAEHIAQGRDWLHQGLDLLGIGAKTAVGYGVLSPVA